LAQIAALLLSGKSLPHDASGFDLFRGGIFARPVLMIVTAAPPAGIAPLQKLQ